MSKFQFEARLTCEECFSGGSIIAVGDHRAPLTYIRRAIFAGTYGTVMEAIPYEHGQVTGQ